MIDVKGKNPKKYIEAKRIIVVQCQNCKQGGKPNAALLAVTSVELIAMAEVLHTELIQQTKIICATPQLVIECAAVLVHESLIARPETNGKII